MSSITLQLLDKFFFTFHTIRVAFNIVGRARRKTRRLHRITVPLTAFSWLIPEAFHGRGYCLCTDSHFRVRRALGFHDVESSYVQLLINHILAIELARPTITAFALVVAAATIGYRRNLRAPAATPSPLDQSANM